MSTDGNLAALGRHQAKIDRASAEYELVCEEVADGYHMDAIIDQVIDGGHGGDVLYPLLYAIGEVSVERHDRTHPRPTDPSVSELRDWHRQRARVEWRAVREALEHWQGFEAFLERYIEEEMLCR